MAFYQDWILYYDFSTGVGPLSTILEKVFAMWNSAFTRAVLMHNFDAGT